VGLMDKMKSAAQDVAAGAAKATEKGKTKVEEVQLKRKQDDAAKQLGYLIHAERTQGTSNGAEVERLIAEMTSLEAEIVARGSSDTTP
jgi:hypothetical protein